MDMMGCIIETNSRIGWTFFWEKYTSNFFYSFLYSFDIKYSKTANFPDFILGQYVRSLFSQKLPILVQILKTQ